MTNRSNVPSRALKIVAVLFMVYIVYTLITTQVQITSKREELNTLETLVEEQKAKNAEISYQIENDSGTIDDYAEEYARSELGYAKQGEKVFVNVSGN